MLMFLPDIMEAQDGERWPRLSKMTVLWRQSVDVMKFLDAFFPSTTFSYA